MSDDRRIVAVDQKTLTFIVALLGMAGQVDLAHLGEREIRQITGAETWRLPCVQPISSREKSTDCVPNFAAR
jgi:hypothetical protein